MTERAANNIVPSEMEKNKNMANAVIMPKQGQSVESCIITEWKKNVGDTVAKGDVLFSYETDKSAFDEVSEVEGTMLKILADAGDDVPCFDTVCIIGTPGEDISALIPAKAEEKKPDAAPAAEEKKAEEPAKQADAPAATGEANVGGRLKISPRARCLVEKTNADLSHVVPTGPDGRIIERDIQKVLDGGFTVPASVSERQLLGEIVKEEVKEAPAAAPAAAPAVAPVAADYTDEPMSRVRKVIAKSMIKSLTELAQFTLNTSFDASALVALRAQLKAGGESLGLTNITYNDMILFAVAKTLATGNYKALNANLIDNGETIRYFNGVNLGIAVNTDRGLLVPTVFNAQTLTLNDLAKKSKQLSTDCVAGTASPEVLHGASFTVSNIGPTGIESFTPVINPPQTAILGVCSLTKRVKEKDGEAVFYPCIPLSLTIDHRAVDGAPAAKFLADLVKNLENFNLLLTK